MPILGLRPMPPAQHRLPRSKCRPYRTGAFRLRRRGRTEPQGYSDLGPALPHRKYDRGQPGLQHEQGEDDSHPRAPLRPHPLHQGGAALEVPVLTVAEHDGLAASRARPSRQPRREWEPAQMRPQPARPRPRRGRRQRPGQPMTPTWSRGDSVDRKHPARWRERWVPPAWTWSRGRHQPCGLAGPVGPVGPLRAGPTAPTVTPGGARISAHKEGDAPWSRPLFSCSAGAA